ncbi:MAG: restriction endonuclease subunit S [Gemmatimonadetes bacterium]|nr:restriction endonuclease subunit S [Gemmatimonadota bacterium]MYB59455.1 restriction endonuclease subunit S [Gemmatimonadota bacterium]
MTDRLDLPSRYRDQIEVLLREHVPGVEVWAYGSRVNGESHDASDLDLVLRGPDLERIPSGQLADLTEALEQSNVPIIVQIHDWARLPESFHREIEQAYVVLVEEKELGRVSDGWISLRLGDVCTKIGSGATPRGGQEVYLEEGHYALIRSQNVYNNGFNYDGLAFINQQQATDLKNVEVFADDVLLNITGDSVARVCQVAPDVLPARVNQHVAIIRPNPNKLSPRFLRYFLVSPEIQATLLSWAGSGGTRNALTKGMIESFDVQAPMDVAEQRAIAHILGTLDDKIELNRRMNETLEEMARALFKSWFVDFDPVHAKMEGRDPGLPTHLADLFPNRLVDSELGPIPEGWEVKALEQFIELNPRESIKRGTLAPYLNMAALPISGPNPDDPILREYTSGTRFRNGDTLFARITPCLENGKTAFVQVLPKDTVGWGSTEFIVMRAIPPVTSVYPYLLARDPAFRAHAIQSMTGTSGRQRARTEALAPYQVAFPTTEVWTVFALIIEPLFSKIHVNSEESRTLAVQRDTLLPKLVSGELRVDGRAT